MFMGTSYCCFRGGAVSTVGVKGVERDLILQCNAHYLLSCVALTLYTYLAKGLPVYDAKVS